MKAASLHLLVLLVSGWLTRNQQAALEYLIAENKVLCEQLGPKRSRFTARERRLLAEKGKALDRKRLGELACLAPPYTILRWFREFVAKKKRRRMRAAGTRAETRELVVRMARENPG